MNNEKQHITYQNCEFTCYSKYVRTRKGTQSMRVFCRKTNPKCQISLEPEPIITKPAVVTRAEAISEDVQLAENIIAKIQSIPQKPLTAAQVFPTSDFTGITLRRRRGNGIIMSPSYIGTTAFGIVKNFRQDITARLETLHKKYPQVYAPDKYEEFLNSILGKDFGNRTWQVAGMIPVESDKSKIHIPYQDNYEEIAILVDCNVGEVTHCSYKLLRLFLDGCPNVKFGGNDYLSPIQVECNDSNIGVFMPMKGKLHKKEMLILANLLCYLREK